MMSCRSAQLAGRDYVQDERYFAIEHRDVRREASQVCTVYQFCGCVGFQWPFNREQPSCALLQGCTSGVSQRAGTPCRCGSDSAGFRESPSHPSQNLPAIHNCAEQLSGFNGIVLGRMCAGFIPVDGCRLHRSRQHGLTECQATQGCRIE